MSDQLKVEMRVHGVYNVPISSEVELDGEKMVAHVQAVEIELAGAHPWDGSTKFRFAGQEADWARRVFKVDETITLTFDVPDAPAEPAPPAEQAAA